MNNRNAKIGTPHAQYAGPEDGPFICMDCIHFSHIKGTVKGNCDHPDVAEDAKAGYILEVKGKPVVHHEGCCSYFQKPKVDAAKLAGVK